MKTFRSAFVAAALGLPLILLAVLATACGSAGTYAAKVNDQTISEDSLVGELRSIAANEAYLKQVESQQQVRGTGQGTFDSAFTALALTRQIYYTLIGNELVTRKLTVTDADLAAARAAVIDQLEGENVFAAFPKSYQDDLVRRQAELDVLTVSVNGLESADKAARAYYDANPNQFATACASHILVADRGAGPGPARPHRRRRGLRHRGQGRVQGHGQRREGRRRGLRHHPGDRVRARVPAGRLRPAGGRGGGAGEDRSSATT